MTNKAVQSSEDLDAMLQMFEAELKQVAPAKQPPQQQHQQQRRISSSSSSKRPVRSGVRASAVLAAPAVPSTLAQQQQELSAASAASSAVTTIARPPITTLQELDYLTSKVVAQEQRAKSLNAGLYMESGGQPSVVSLTTSNAAFFARPVTQQSSSNTLNSADGSGAGGGGGASSSSSGSGKSKSKYGKKTHKKSMRTGAGSVWEDQTMEQWPDNDYRLFCGDLGNEVNEDILRRTFGSYASFAKAHVVRDKKSGKTKGFGFVSFLNQEDYTKAFREWNGKYVGNRPIKLKKSTWKDRAVS